MRRARPSQACAVLLSLFPGPLASCLLRLGSRYKESRVLERERIGYCLNGRKRVQTFQRRTSEARRTISLLVADGRGAKRLHTAPRGTTAASGSSPGGSSPRRPSLPRPSRLPSRPSHRRARALRRHVLHSRRRRQTRRRPRGRCSAWRGARPTRQSRTFCRARCARGRCARGRGAPTR